MVLSVLRGSPLLKGLNDTFFTLIPKVQNVETVTQLWPIGLCSD